MSSESLHGPSDADDEISDRTEDGRLVEAVLGTADEGDQSERERLRRE